MKFEIDTEKKTITLKESVKLSDFLKEIAGLNITIEEWSLCDAIQNHSEIVWPQIPYVYPCYTFDTNRVTCEK